MAAMQAHPWNERFEWHDHAGPFSRLTPDEVAQFDEHGFVVVPDLVDPATIAAVRDELDALEAEVDAFLQTRDDGRFSITETGALTIAIHAVTRAEAAKALSAHPSILGLCRDLVGPDVRLYWDQAVYKKTEKPRRVPWHQDNGYTYVEPQEYLTVWLALTDATDQNGCPEVAPGCHRLGTLEHHYVDPLGWECLEEGTPSVAAPVPAGGAVVFSSLTPHRTGPNLTSEVRKAYILQYCPSGAEILQGDPRSGPPVARVPCTAPERQYEVLRSGEPVAV
jgi:ectoine hydroxylase-related dioxygenase (phytanoyl-CoA dioxygenase family)